MEIFHKSQARKLKTGWNYGDLSQVTIHEKKSRLQNMEIFYKSQTKNIKNRLALWRFVKSLNQEKKNASMDGDFSQVSTKKIKNRPESRRFFTTLNQEKKTGWSYGKFCTSLNQGKKNMLELLRFRGRRFCVCGSISRIFFRFSLLLFCIVLFFFNVFWVAVVVFMRIVGCSVVMALGTL